MVGTRRRRATRRCDESVRDAIVFRQVGRAEDDSDCGGDDMRFAERTAGGLTAGRRMPVATRGNGITPRSARGNDGQVRVVDAADSALSGGDWWARRVCSVAPV